MKHLAFVVLFFVSTAALAATISNTPIIPGSLQGSDRAPMARPGSGIAYTMTIDQINNYVQMRVQPDATKLDLAAHQRYSSAVQEKLDAKANTTDLPANKATLSKISESAGAPLWNGEAWPGSGAGITPGQDVRLGNISAARIIATSYETDAPDGQHYVRPYNSVDFSGVPAIGMVQSTPAGVRWYDGSAWSALYALPIASATTPGGVKVGSGLTVDGSGVLSVTAGAATGGSGLAVTPPVTGAQTIAVNNAYTTYSSASSTVLTMRNYTSVGMFKIAATTRTKLAPSASNVQFKGFGNFSTSPGYSVYIPKDTIVEFWNYGDGIIRALAALVKTGINEFTSIVRNTFSDSFAYSDGPLPTVSGGIWATPSWAGDMAVSSGTIVGSVNYGYNAAYLVSATSADLSVQITGTDIRYQGGGPAVRMSTTEATCYYVDLNDGNLYKMVAGTSTTMGNFTPPINGQATLLQVSGNTLTVKVAGTTVLTTTDSSSPLTTGKGGIYSYRSVSAMDDVVIGAL